MQNGRVQVYGDTAILPNNSQTQARGGRQGHAVSRQGAAPHVLG